MTNQDRNRKDRYRLRMKRGERWSKGKILEAIEREKRFRGIGWRRNVISLCRRLEVIADPFWDHEYTGSESWGRNARGLSERGLFDEE